MGAVDVDLRVEGEVARYRNQVGNVGRVSGGITVELEPEVIRRARHANRVFRRNA